MDLLSKNVILILLVLGLFSVIILGNQCVFNEGYVNYHGWMTYCQKPYGRCSTAPKQADWYPLPVYRKPYRWPYKFQTNYPFKYQTPLE